MDGFQAYKTVVSKRPGGKAPLPITLAYCWSHARRKLRDAQRQGVSPVAEEALRRIAALYRIETEIRGRSAEERLAARRARSAPLVAEMRAWLEEQASRLSRKMPVGEAVRHAALRHWDGLGVFLEDGRVEIDSNAVERSFKPQILVRKNALFACADSGAEHWAMISSLIETPKFNDINPQAYIRDVLETMVAGFPANRIDDLLPWTWSERHRRPEPRAAVST